MVRLVSQSVTGSHSVPSSSSSSSFCVQFFSNYFFSLKKHARLLLRPQKISSTFSWILCAVGPGRLPPPPAPPLSVVVMPAEVVLAIVHPLPPLVILKVIIMQEQLQISALSKPAFINLIYSRLKLFFSAGKL